MTSNGAHDFDFIHGHWVVHNTKLRDVTDPECEEWVEFDATSEVSHPSRARTYRPDPRAF